MLAYYILIGIPAILTLFFFVVEKVNKIKIKNSNCIVIDSFFIVWLLMLIFRSQEVGIDLPVYKYHFVHYSLLSWQEIFYGIFMGKFEATYVIITKIVSYFTNNFQWIMIICALISVIPIWYFYKNESKHPFLSIILFVNVAPFVMYFSGLRQAMAMSFMVPAYYYCKDRKILKYLAVVLIAFLTHNSGLVLLLMYPMYHIKFDNKYYLLLLLPIFAVLYVYKMPIFVSVFNIIGGRYFSEYSSGIKETGAVAVLLLLIALLIYVFVISDNSKIDRNAIGLRNILIMCAVIQIFAGVHTVTMRLNYYYLLLVPIIISKFIDVSKRNLKQIINVSIFCMVSFFLVYFFYNGYTDEDTLHVFPYKTVFEDYRY